MYESDDAIDSDIVIRAKHGDAIALQRLLYHSSNLIRRQLHRKIPCEFAAQITVDDILQETWWRVQQQIAALKSDCPSTFSAWFRRIAENQLYTQVRALRTKKRGGDHERLVSEGDNSVVTGLSDKALTPARTAERDEIVVAVQGNLDELPTTQRKAMKMHHLEALTVKETAEKLGKSPTEVRGLLGRAKRTLRSALGGSSKWFSRK